jgi:hypothetical protein
MATLNLDDRSESALIAEAGRLGCGVLVKKAMASGHAGIDSLEFAVSHAGVSSVVVGTLDPRHLRANARAVADP